MPPRTNGKSLGRVILRTHPDAIRQPVIFVDEQAGDGTVPAQPEQALDIALTGRDRAVDAGEIEGRRFFNVAGIGFDAAMATLVRSVMLGMKHAAPYMKKQGSGSIINFASAAIDFPNSNVSVYAMTKAAVHMLTRELAIEAGPHGVRVNSISPGGIATGNALGVGGEDRQIFVFGNGGSAANASHFVTDLGKGASDKVGKRFRVLSLTDNVSWMTALGNDYSYEDVFVGQLQNYGKPGDIALSISVSGNSPNCVKALDWAKKNGLRTVALVGALDRLRSDVAIDFKSSGMARWLTLIPMPSTTA